MEKLRKAFRIILIIKGFIYLLLPLVVWIRNPELTQMEVFLDSWFVIVIGLFMFLLSSFLLRKQP